MERKRSVREKVTTKRQPIAIEKVGRLVRRFGTCAAHARAGFDVPAVRGEVRSPREQGRRAGSSARTRFRTPIGARRENSYARQKATRNPTWRGKWIAFPKDVPRVSSSALLPRASTRDAARPEALIRTLRITKRFSYVTMCLRGNGNDAYPLVIARRRPCARPPRRLRRARRRRLSARAPYPPASPPRATPRARPPPHARGGPTPRARARAAPRGDASPRRPH